MMTQSNSDYVRGKLIIAIDEATRWLVAKTTLTDDEIAQIVKEGFASFARHYHTQGEQRTSNIAKRYRSERTWLYPKRDQQ